MGKKLWLARELLPGVLLRGIFNMSHPELQVGGLFP